MHVSTITERRRKLARRFSTSSKTLAGSERDRRFRTLIEKSVNAIILIDVEGFVLYANPATSQILGYDLDEFVGRNCLTLIHPDDLELATTLLTQLIETPGSSMSTQFRYHHKNDSWRWVEGTLKNLLDDPAMRAIVSSFRDITERRKMEEQASEKLTGWVNDVEQRAREITLLNKMGEMFQTCRTMKEAYEIVARSAQQLFPGMSGAVFMFGSPHNLVEEVMVWGDSPPNERVFVADDCWALRRGQLHCMRDPRTDLVCRHVNLGGTLLPASFLCVPMMAQGQMLGILHLRSSPEANRPALPMMPQEVFPEIKQRLATTVAGHISLALANLKLRESLLVLSIHDPLTGLFNRRHMEESLERELHRAKRNQSSLGIIMLDLDHFKHFNDTFGHEAGDILLETLGRFLETHLRGEDIACRYGGEEFILMLVDASAENVQRRAEELRESVKQLRAFHGNHVLGPITISVGTSLFPNHGTSVQELLQAADSALYSAKANGRDQVKSAP